HFAAVAHVAVGAAAASRLGIVVDAGDGIAAVGGAGIAVVGIERGAGDAGAGEVAGFVAVADVAVFTRGAGGHRGVLGAGERIAAVEGARVAVVHVERCAGDTRAGAVAAFVAVALVTVGARGAGGGGCMHDADEGIAAIDG